MPKRNTERLFDQIRRMAERLTEGDDAKATSAARRAIFGNPASTRTS